MDARADAVDGRGCAFGHARPPTHRSRSRTRHRRRPSEWTRGSSAAALGTTDARAVVQVRCRRNASAATSPGSPRGGDSTREEQGVKVAIIGAGAVGRGMAQLFPDAVLFDEPKG